MISEILKELGLEAKHRAVQQEKNFWKWGAISSFSPVDGKNIGQVSTITVEEYDRCIDQAHEAF